MSQTIPKEKGISKEDALFDYLLYKLTRGNELAYSLFKTSKMIIKFLEEYESDDSTEVQ